VEIRMDLHIAIMYFCQHKILWFACGKRKFPVDSGNMKYSKGMDESSGSYQQRGVGEGSLFLRIYDRLFNSL